ncbi:MAG: MGMT family protein [Caldisericaceae bacterium]
MQYRVVYFGVPLIVSIENGTVLSVLFADDKGKTIDDNIKVSNSLTDDLSAFAQGNHSVLKFSLEGAPLKIRPILLKAIDTPFGKVISYGGLSEAVFGNSRYSRFVGFAMGRNPLPVIVPCHRVVFADGTFNGFSAPLSIKRKLLEGEGVVSCNGKIDKTFFINF